MFEGEARPLPGPMARGSASFRPVTERPEPVRHAEGYDGFAAFVTGVGVDPAPLATDLPALLAFDAAHPELLDDDELARSAAIFLGNAMLLTYPRAQWRVVASPEVGVGGMSAPVDRALRLLIEHPERHEEYLRLLAEWPDRDRDDEEMRALTRNQRQVRLALPATPFPRPPLPDEEHVDPDGSRFRYGDPDRWPTDGPPPAAYSQVTHPERFAALPSIVSDLADHLAGWYDVEVRRGQASITLVPREGATVTLRFADGVVHLKAGALLTRTAPTCTCDACNESLRDAVDLLEDVLLGVAGGGLVEQYPVGMRRWTRTSLQTPSGGEGSSGGLDPDEDEHEVRRLLGALPDGRWPAWPPRDPTRAADRG